MSGSIKVGGNTIATHTGAQGAGEVTLGTNLRLPASGGIQDSSGNNILTESGGNVSVGNVRLPASGGIKDSSGNNILTESGGNTTISNSAIKLKSSGNSITKSDGTTAVLSESGAVVTLDNVQLGESVNPNNSFAYYTMTGTGSAGTGVGVCSTRVTVLEDSDFYSSSFASNTLTITIAKVGHYKISNSFYIYGNSNVPTYTYEGYIGGTCTKYGLPTTGVVKFDSGLSQAIANAHNNITLTFLISATASQTVSIYPIFPFTLNSGNLFFGSNLEIQKVK